MICLDNFYTGSERNIESIRNDPHFELVEHDVTMPIDLQVDGIFNLACPASPIHYQRHPVQTLKTSIFGTINLLELAHKHGARILQASTSEVYGDPDISPQDETYWGNVNPVGIRSCYDEGKRAAETAIFDFHRQYGVDIRVARIFNTYGTRMAINDGRVVSNFIVQALKGDPLTIYGDGTQTRSFCYVDDLISGLIALFETEGLTGPVNIGNPQPITMLELAEEILALTGSRSEIVFMPLPSDDPKQRMPDTTLAFEKLQWSPTITRNEGLSKTVEYFKSVLQTN